MKPSQRLSAIVFLALACAVLAPAGKLLAHEEGGSADAGHVPARVLGHISFPTMTRSEEAQAAFIQGMLLLHLFEYPYAREQFLEAQRLDPDFAMAYWGEAMTFNHPIWDQQNLAAARSALAKLGATPAERLEKTPSAREKGLLAALDVLYGQGTKAQRDASYMRAMEQLAARFPEDPEIRLFYALSLLGVNAGVRDTATYMMATAIAQEVFCQNPDHPGAAHYLIHGVDDPLHAVLGLRAARALARMAPDAGHAQHMASHIFTALGMWDDVVSANEAAVKVQNSMREEHGLSARHWGHYNFWLLYGYLQQGRTVQARELLTSAYAEAEAADSAPEDPMALDPDSSLVGSVVQMWTRYLVETRDLNGDLSNWSFKSGKAYDPNLNISFVKTLQATQSGLVAQAGQYQSQFRALKSELEEAVSKLEEKPPSTQQYLDRLAVMDLLLSAAIEEARGETGKAIELAGQASEREGSMPYSFGPPFIDLPSAEMLGELLLKARRYDEAARAFEIQLKRSRLKPRSLVGLIQSLDATGSEAEAAYHRETLQRLRGSADDSVKVSLP
ncbi:MAG: hypothetical protein PVJ33_06515 [Lysobacterales bacterium]|jgi:tetratricopeptide (TPR) repeat protein